VSNLPVLETERLLLAVPTAGDFSRVRDFFARNAEHLSPWAAVMSDAALEDVIRRRVNGAEQEYRGDRGLWMVLARRENPAGPMIGDVHLSNVVRGAFQACYLGYQIDREAEGQGLMTEAVGAVIDYAFRSMNLHRVMANHQPGNERSARVLARLGFSVEGIARNYLHIGGAWRDHVLTSLTNDDWTPRPA